MLTTVGGATLFLTSMAIANSDPAQSWAISHKYADELKVGAVPFAQRFQVSVVSERACSWPSEKGKFRSRDSPEVASNWIPILESVSPPYRWLED